MTEASYERLRMARFHLYILPEQTKPQVQKTDQRFPGAGVERRRLPAKGQEVTSEIREMVCSLISRCLHWTGAKGHSGFPVISYRRTQMNFWANPVLLLLSLLFLTAVNSNFLFLLTDFKHLLLFSCDFFSSRFN